MKFAASEAMLVYFNGLETELNRAIALANSARANGADPKPEIEIPIAKDLADRVEKLIGVEGVARRLRELEESMSREEASLQLGLEVASGKIKQFDSKKDAIEAAVRIAMAVLTEGVVAAPIEGIAKIDLAKNDDGSEYIRIYYAGPIRSAGGTAQALSVLAADYVRINLGINRFVPRPEEVERYVEEITAYHRAVHLQYLPTDEEIRLIVRNCPICIDGEPTEEAEVEGRRDLERIETNRIRGGMALVIAEGIALKAPKVKKHVDKLKLDGWDWLEKFTVTVKSDDTSAQLKPKDKYLQDLIAGRPVFSYPSRPGGFRLRYGRSRNTCFAAAGISPATMILMDDFLAAGTQIKIERPGKAAGIAPVDTIEGPTVRLFNGDVLRVDTAEEAQRIRPSVQRILDIGEILINYGDFLENNHPLVPSSYCYEWWVQELASKTPIKDLGDLKNPDENKALSLSDTYKVPLHPKYTYLWHDISLDEYCELAEYIQQNGKFNGKLSIPLDSKIKTILETLLVPHIVREKQIHIEEPLPFIRCMGLARDLKKTWTATETDIMETVSRMSGITIRRRAPIRIGGRMGRPEKSDKREMKPAPHVLFPIGEAGGRRRSLQSAKEYVDDDGGERNNEFKIGLSVQKEKVGTIKVQIGERICPSCKIRTFKNRCKCGKFTNAVLRCHACGIEVNRPVCPKCKKETTSVTETSVDLKKEYMDALENVGERDNVAIKGVLGLTSKNKTPEPLEKGILRAKHDIVMFKDGTVRYDLSDLPLTHIRPREIGVPAAKLKELGYEKDIYGRPLTDENQTLELKVQDIVVSKDCAEYLLKTARFVDDLLTKYYKVGSYYNMSRTDDLIGKLVIGLAPHTSAGVLGRLIGFTTASVGYAHPFFHAAKRRNCDGDEDCVMLLMDGLLNFSRSYLPDKRGGQMDAPLVLTSRIDPNEVDKETHNVDVTFQYPLEFYEATMKFMNPRDIVKLMDTVSGRLGTPAQYEGFGFTHDTSNIAAGPRNSAYKTLGTMIEKMDAQLALARKIRAVDPQDVAERIINSHFLPDLIGNLRSFSKQKVRCTKCNAKFRRPPLRGTCPKCGGNIVLTVHEGSVRKYLETSLRIADEYNVRHYTKQRLELLELEMRSLFESDKVKQKGLADFM
ncbi:MAG: DNA polymerase II large subunit [Candidatus Methanoperedens sp.]|nr:DNA polymerase II large subunit [Candidatus Methanoperedens sp.]MCZ7369636.1 DNA polymerase II large subunit [Candidatus Methanoperedens sp.]